MNKQKFEIVGLIICFFFVYWIVVVLSRALCFVVKFFLKLNLNGSL